jgi:hypothetical protein
MTHELKPAPRFLERSIPSLLALLALLLVLAGPAPGSAGTQAPDRLWVVQRPEGIVEYDLTTFAAIQTVQVPERIFFYPEFLSINARGQMLYRDQDGTWYWNGRAPQELKPRSTVAEGDSAGTPTRITAAQDVWLSADGERLYWFEQRSEQTINGEGYERSQRGECRVWRTDPSGAGADTIIHIRDDEWCPCLTGACSETCAEWDPWAPNGLVRDRLFLMSFTPGQLEPGYGPTRRYHESSGTWPYEEMPETLPILLDASEDGRTVIGAEPDGGCCAWENESSDQVVLLEDGRRSVLYDEFTRFRNQNWDVSFRVTRAQISPDGAAVAYTLEATNDGRPFRLSSEGKRDVADSARIAREAAALPVVEVLRLGGGEPDRIARGRLVGWLSDTEVLLVEDERVAVFDTHGKLRRDSGIRVSTPAAVFLAAATQRDER